MDDYGASRIPPGDSFTMKYDLSALYDFKEPGKYTVYIQVVDSLAAKARAGSTITIGCLSGGNVRIEPSTR